MSVNDKSVKLSIWDTAGFEENFSFSSQERFRSISTQYYRGSTGCILCYDITRSESLQNCDKWLMDVRINCGDTLPIMLVGNKKDLAYLRKVQESQGRNFQKKHGLFNFYETSALDGENIENVFNELIEAMMEMGLERSNQTDPVKKLSVFDEPPKNTGKNCSC